MKKISIASVASLIISILAFVLYGRVLSGKNMFLEWTIMSIVALVFPIFAKYCRNKRGAKGKVLEILALILGSFDFYCVIFAATTLNVYIAFAVIAIVCVIYAKSFNNPSREAEDNQAEKE